jgi:hypothetical protein
MRRWKRKLGNSGLDVKCDERLTNIRYADDLIIYASSCSELCYMLEALVAELEHVGLSLNTSKTKMFTTEALQTPLLVDISSGMVEALSGKDSHKYLGRKVPGELRLRNEIEYNNRIAAAWGSFHKHRPYLMNNNVDIKLRLKLFESIVTPTVLFGLTTLPLTASKLQQLDAVRRRMLRSIVGWKRHTGEEWSCTVRRVNLKMDAALTAFPLETWTAQLANRQFQLAARFLSKPASWPLLVAKWDPSDLYRRQPGRPRVKWDDNLTKFSGDVFGKPWHEVSLQMWVSKRGEFSL